MASCRGAARQSPAAQVQTEMWDYSRWMKLTAALLYAGIVASLWYAAVNVIVPLHDASYDWQSQTVSELSAIDAPTRDLWVWLCAPYGFLMGAFGWGVLRMRGSTLAWAGWILIASAVVGAFWPPMHQREVLAAGGGTATDILHIAFTMFWGMASFAVMILASIEDKRATFRAFTAAMAAATIFFGILTGIQSPDMQKNLPTPTLGAYERIGIAAYMFWVIAFAATLLVRLRRNL